MSAAQGSIARPVTRANASEAGRLRLGNLTSIADAARVMRTWSENREWPPDEALKLLNSYFLSPGPLPSVAPAVYDVTGSPDSQQACHAVSHSPGASASWRCSRSSTSCRNGEASASECDCGASAFAPHSEWGTDGAIAEGNRSNFVTAAGAAEVAVQSREFMRVPFMMRSLRTYAQTDAPAEVPSVDHFMEAADAVARVTPLARLWSQPEAEWQCARRDDAVSVTSPAPAAISGYRAVVLDGPGTPCTFIDDILWHQSRDEERARLLNKFLALAARHSELAIVPVLNYADMSPFAAAGFRRSPRSLRAYLTMWTGGTETEFSPCTSTSSDYSSLGKLFTEHHEYRSKNDRRELHV